MSILPHLQISPVTGWCSRCFALLPECFSGNWLCSLWWHRISEPRQGLRDAPVWLLVASVHRPLCGVKLPSRHCSFTACVWYGAFCLVWSMRVKQTSTSSAAWWLFAPCYFLWESLICLLHLTYCPIQSYGLLWKVCITDISWSKKVVGGI